MFAVQTEPFKEIFSCSASPSAKVSGSRTGARACSEPRHREPRKVLKIQAPSDCRLPLDALRPYPKKKVLISYIYYTSASNLMLYSIPSSSRYKVEGIAHSS